MAQKLNPPLLVAVDTNVALDLADQCEAIVDSLNTIRERIGAGVLCISPTVVLELGHAADFGETAAKRTAARQFLRQHSAWHFQLAPFVPVGHAQAVRVGDRLRACGLIPEDEVNDSLVLAEAALLGCRMLLTDDEHLRGIDFERLAFELQSFDLTPPVMATPREVVRKFFR